MCLEPFALRQRRVPLCLRRSLEGLCACASKLIGSTRALGLNSLIVLSLALHACGGGGGSNSGNSTLAGGGSGGIGAPAGSIASDAAALATDAREPPPSAPDPGLGRQWHLLNSGQFGGIVGEDLRLADLPETGEGVLVAVIDGAVQISHPDLVWRFVPGASYSYRTGGTDPSPPQGSSQSGIDTDPGGADDAHGTAVAGIIAATANNSIGGRGVAPRARLMGLDVLVNPTDANIADAVSRAVESGAAVVNNSWGPLDPGSGGDLSYTKASLAWKRAVERAVTEGRSGRGTVIVFAAGNGGNWQDRSDYDEFTNDPNVIAVGAVDDRGRVIGFSEPGANVLIAGFSGVDLRRGPDRPGIYTTDIAGRRGYGDTSDADPDYTQIFRGTSASAPMISGIVALMLQANPLLTWRDVRWILAHTARAASGLNQVTVASANAMTPHAYDPRVGFGIAHATNAVSLARSFQTLGSEIVCDSGQLVPETIASRIPDASSAGIELRHLVGPECTIGRIEVIELSLATDHPYSGDLAIRLNAPSQRSVELSRRRLCSQEACTPIRDGFRFGIVRFMGEAPAGTWVLRIADEASDDTGRLLWWRLRLRGHR